MPEKEGLQTAIDFTKYLITMAGGAVAFVIKPEFAETGWLKILSIGALVLLTLSVATGLAVFSRGCVMLSEKNYRLEDSRIKILGMINVISFGLSFLLLAIEVAIRVMKA